MSRLFIDATGTDATGSRSVPLWLAVALTLLVAACAEERAPIDRVQPLALDKANFVGADLLDPTDDPEFWTQGTLIDVGYGASQDGLFTSTYAQPLSRMRWQITEDLLIGRLAYERIEGSDGKGVGGAVNDGVIVVAYRIESHFDITHAYNSVTGEKLNILEENSSDRPWFERQYFRVDWSQNLNVDSYDFDTLSQIGVYGGVLYEPMAYDVTDPTDPDAPHFDLETGYFDITTKAFAKPQTIDLSHLGWGIDSFPACFLDNDFMGGSYPSGNCNPVELTIRQSFRKVVDTDYEPMDWDGYRFQAYGAFSVERFGFSENYGMTDSQWKRFITRYNIWERSHYYTDPVNMTGEIACYTATTTPYGVEANRDVNDDGTDDECVEAGAGSRCDPYRNRCTLPYQERTAKPVVWYYTAKDQEWFEPTARAAHDWDVGLRMAVRSAQYSECVRVGGTECAARFPLHFGQQSMNEDTVALSEDVDACRAEGRDEASCQAIADTVGAQRGYDAGVIAIAKMPEMLVLCHSPVQADDNVLCGEARLPEGITADACHGLRMGDDSELGLACAQALTVRMGDLRYHQVNVIEEPQTPSPWGIYTDAEDPLTGETVAASINVWGYINNLWSQRIVDRLRYMAGEYTTEQVTEGDFVRDWANAAKAAGAAGMAPKLTKEERAQRLDDFAGKVPTGATPENLPAGVREAAKNLRREMQGVAATWKAPSTMRPIIAARADHARGTDFEAQLITPMIQALAGIEGMPTNKASLDAASILRGANPSFQREFEQWRQIALSDRGACVLYDGEALAPHSLTGLSTILQEKFGAFNPDDDVPTQQARAERMRRYVAHHAHRSVITHEMGHSIGLRHNFVSSADASNYRAQYWQLRTKNGTVNTACTELTADGESCVGPRYFDPVTDEERDNLIWMWMQSSVMDYAGEATQDMIGPGAWDYAATRMFYGDNVAVFANDAGYGLGTANADLMLGKMDSFGGILGLRWEYEGEDIHYSQLQKHLNIIHDCEPVNPGNFKPNNWDEEAKGAWHPVLDGHLVSIDGAYTRCAEQEVDYVPWSALRTPTEAEVGWYWGGPSIDANDRLRVPYGFATDRWADLGNASVYRHDNGADIYELFDFLITQQEMNHIFDNYRQGRMGFSVRSAANRALHRYNEKMRDAAKGLTLMKNIYKNFLVELSSDFNGYWPLYAQWLFADNILASGIAFDHFTRSLARPEHGPHYADPINGVLRSDFDAPGNGGTTLLTVPNGATGYFDNVSLGGRPIENQLASNKGEFDSDFTINAGSYYEKMYTSMLLTESVDNYISSSRTDFIDARDRATSMADLFPDGYRRWLGNNLTNDDMIRGVRVAANAAGVPETDAEGYPAQGLGWTTWWGETPRSCFPAENTTVCSSYGAETDSPWSPEVPANVAVLDPQIGWEQQKFLIAWTLLYLPENQQQHWIDQMRVWELGEDADPAFVNRIELHYPSGKTYVAKTFGKELIFGKVVQKGISARVLEYANELIGAAYETDPGPDLDGDGNPDWYLPRLDPTTGEPLVKWDPTIEVVIGEYVYANGGPGCQDGESWECTCTSNRSCMALERYMELPFFMRQAMHAYGLVEPSPKGIY